MSSNNNNKKEANTHKEKRHVVIYGYTKQELQKVMRHFEAQLPDFIKISIENSHLITKITITGVHEGSQLLSFMMNKHQQSLKDIFAEELVASDDKSVAQVLGELLTERELTVSTAESCTGGNIAHRIVEIPGSSSYFLGSVVSYSNDVKANVLGVERRAIDKHGAVSEQVVTAMASGVAKLMRSHCALATSGIAGPDGGTKFKPVGTVWLAAKYRDRIVSECVHFPGNRNEVIESATNHAMMMLIRLLQNSYIMQEDINDD